MALETPALSTVTPGDPVTAQGWNGLVTGLIELYEAVRALGGGVLEVAVTAGTSTVPGAEVIAEPVPAGGDRRPVRALPPAGARTSHLLAGLTEGDWQIHVRAAGLTQPEPVRVVTIPGAGQPGPAPVAIAMAVAGVVVPDLFGRALQVALNELAGTGEAGLPPGLVLDTNGRDISTVTIPPEYVGAIVLAQLPPAGAVVPATEPVRMVVATAVRRDPVVTMPDLTGLTLTEARGVLERLGLQLGTSDIRADA